MFLITDYPLPRKRKMFVRELELVWKDFCSECCREAGPGGRLRCHPDARTMRARVYDWVEKERGLK